MRVILLCSFLLVSWSSFAQFEALEDSVFIYRSATFNAKTDSDRIAANNKLYSLLVRSLADPGTFAIKFEKVKGISIQTSPDKKFRIFSWNIQMNDYSQRFYGLLQTNFRNKDLPTLVELVNSNTKSIDWENEITGRDNWYGAVYYDMIPMSTGSKPMVMLLGWRGEDRLVSQKVIDVIHFDKNRVNFGAPVIQHGNNLKKRAIFNYPAEISFSLKYNKETDQIIFDRLAPNDPRNVGNYANYSPQFIFDAYKLEKKKWTLVQEVDVRMPEREKKPLPVPPHLQPSSKK